MTYRLSRLADRDLEAISDSIAADAPRTADRFLDTLYAPQDVTATVLHALGVNPRQAVRDAFGRQVPLSSGQVRETLFGV